MKKPAPQPSLDDIVFLMQQLQIMDHSRDRDAIHAIAKKYNIWSTVNHTAKLGRLW